MSKRYSRRWARLPDERGQVLVWTLVLLPLLLVVVGLVLDGGLLFVQFRRARWAADGAAVAAASSIDPALYARTGRVTLDNVAIAAAMHYAQLNDADLHLTSVYVQANTIRVQGMVALHPTFLSLFGIGSVPVHVTGEETPNWGIATPGQ